LRAEHDRPVCLTGGPADQDTADIALQHTGGEDGIVSLVGETSLRQLVALSARAHVFVGCDTGPMHIAAACDTPVVALFGPADPQRTGPYGAGHQVVRAPSRKMADITVENVLTAVRDVPARSPV
jgi:ADP-heptose:LPS heptosyltransferase